MTVLMGPRDFIQREQPPRSCSRLTLQAPRTRVRTNSSALCKKHQPLLDTLDPGLHGWVRNVGQANGNDGRDTPADLETRHPQLAI